MEVQKKISANIIKQPGQSDNSRDITFVLSDESPDSDGDIIRVSGWDTARFMSNPVCMGFHSYDSFPYGEWRNVYKDLRATPPRLVGTLHFPTIQELCPSGEVSEHAKNVDMACAMVNAGYLNAVSVGCYYKVAEARSDYAPEVPEWARGKDVKQAELLEVSLVPIPANPHALSQLSADKNITPKMVEFISKSFKDSIESKAAIPFKHYPLAPEDTAWDGPKVVADSDIADLKQIATYYDSSKSDEDLTKGDFKLPHHMAKADGYKTVWKGVAAAYGVLLGARGGADIPESDKPKCKAHLAKHYLEFNKTVPEDKAAWVEQCKSMGFDDLIEKYIGEVVQKEGRRISAMTAGQISKVKDCVQQLKEAMEACEAAINELENGGASEEPGPEDNNGNEGKSIDESIIKIVE